MWIEFLSMILGFFLTLTPFLVLMPSLTCYWLFFGCVIILGYFFVSINVFFEWAGSLGGTPQAVHQPPRMGGEEEIKIYRHTTPRIRWSSPTQLLVWPLPVYFGESGRDPKFPSRYGRMCWLSVVVELK